MFPRVLEQILPSPIQYIVIYQFYALLILLFTSRKLLLTPNKFPYIETRKNNYEAYDIL
jgi:hypothetical protein